MSHKKETFFSIDIETDGPYPGDYSMLSFGAVAFAEDGTTLGSFETNVQALDGASQNYDTMKNFWDKQPVAWEYCTRNPQPPEVAMTKFVEWVAKMPGDLKTAVCMPAGFDFMFMYWYMKKFAGRSPFSFSCIDTKTYVMSMRRKAYRHSGKRSWPKRWFAAKLPHTHKAIDDAVEQGITFMTMRAENLTQDQEDAKLVTAIALDSWNKCDKVSLVGERDPNDPVPEITCVVRHE
ncbi:MAG: exonuclease [Deltaproteobacteria bacterium]|nr:MAG: exonuclease [Deltaproteobacteria bacterium]